MLSNQEGSLYKEYLDCSLPTIACFLPRASFVIGPVFGWQIGTMPVGMSSRHFTFHLQCRDGDGNPTQEVPPVKGDGRFRPPATNSWQKH